LKTELKYEDIQEVFIGIRPIIKSKKDPTHMSREYKLDLHHHGENKILHIYGGKLTTFPSLAQKVLEILV
jgi:glycerol-3-phosphate dehydrogenase